jgi:hypothetical protein
MSPTPPLSCLCHPVVRFNTSVHFDWAISVSPICDPLELGSVILLVELGFLNLYFFFWCPGYWLYIRQRVKVGRNADFERFCPAGNT